jgi:polysaccharide pyruvyl transferase CsaB
VKRRFDVALLGYYGFGNLGDELLLEAFLGLLLDAGVSRERVLVFSSNPARTGATFSVPAADRWAPGSLWSNLRLSSTLLFGGGGLFQDATSLRSVIYYSGAAFASRAARCVPWAFGQSLGPFRTETGNFLSRRAVRSMAFCGVRDTDSLDVIDRWGVPGVLSPDAVFSLMPSGDVRAKADGYLLVNLRPWPGDLNRRAAAAVARCARESGIPVVGVAMSPADESLLQSMDGGGILKFGEIRRPSGTVEMKSLWRNARAAVGMRLHFCILSAMFGIPCTAIPYDPKVRAFARFAGMPCFPQEPVSLSAGTMPETLRTLGDTVRSAFLNAWRNLS